MGNSAILSLCCYHLTFIILLLILPNMTAWNGQVRHSLFSHFYSTFIILLIFLIEMAWSGQVRHFLFHSLSIAYGEWIRSKSYFLCHIVSPQKFTREKFHSLALPTNAVSGSVAAEWVLLFSSELPPSPPLTTITEIVVAL